jgi:hypothetical protein
MKVVRELLQLRKVPFRLGRTSHRSEPLPELRHAFAERHVVAVLF